MRAFCRLRLHEAAGTTCQCGVRCPADEEDEQDDNGSIHVPLEVPEGKARANAQEALIGLEARAY